MASLGNHGNLAPANRTVPNGATEDAGEPKTTPRLPARPGFMMVGDTGVAPTGVTPWPIRVVGREEWEAAVLARRTA